MFNPVNLVESLKLRTNEQQDAQELVNYVHSVDSMSRITFNTMTNRFSKLFMSHLDTEFQKQSDPALKRLLSDQVRFSEPPICSSVLDTV